MFDCRDTLPPSVSSSFINSDGVMFFSAMILASETDEFLSTLVDIDPFPLSAATSKFSSDAVVTGGVLLSSVSVELDLELDLEVDSLLPVPLFSLGCASRMLSVSVEIDLLMTELLESFSSNSGKVKNIGLPPACGVGVWERGEGEGLHDLSYSCCFRIMLER